MRRDAPFTLAGSMGIGFSGSSIIALTDGRINRINPASWSRQTIGGAITGDVNGMTVFDGVAYIMANNCVSAVTLDVSSPSALRVSHSLRLDDKGRSVGSHPVAPMIELSPVPEAAPLAGC